MCMIEFRFERVPSEDDIWSRLEMELGPKARRVIEEVHIAEGVLRVLSMDGVALIYATKVCASLGGTKTNGEATALPPWTAQPWMAYPWFRRLFLRMARASPL